MFKAATLERLVKFIAEQTGYRAYTTRPVDATKRTTGVLVQRVGTWTTGENLPEIDRPVVTLVCIAKTPGECYRMADAVGVAMERFRYEPHVTYCKQYSAYEDSSPEDGPAFKLSYQITYID